MAQMIPEQREALAAAGWTEEEATAFAQALTGFRDSLPPHQRDAFSAMLATAGAAANEEVQGYLTLHQRKAGGGQLETFAGLPPAAGNQVVIAIIAILIG